MQTSRPHSGSSNNLEEKTNQLLTDLVL
ncbi:DUF3037 domain-containing protein [Flavobacterium litorale]|uniref:DUF3037 domain-containing protein n=1 Tax=Flavobacterium litorale TaxID=2856519 RepID=A0ABX8V9Y4_9FLAO|nr:DUF3037 domain-containing protein [Flavobacterium litorale]QYJ69537.1 DUF3037 domain-containing protein [Flavobacterium litorale]